MTTTDAAATAVGPRTYGNWRKEQSAGLWGLGTVGTFVLIGGLAAGIGILLFLGLIPAIVWGCGLGIVAAIMLWKDFSGRPYARTAATKVTHMNAKRVGNTVSLSGPLTPAISAPLPGVIGTTMLGEFEDTRGNPFSLVSYRNGFHTVPFECRPDGVTNVDQQDVDMMVARYGLWLASHGEQEGLVMAEMIIETAPDTGQKLNHTIDGQRGENPPEVARVVMEKIAQTYPSRTATIRAFGSVTYNEKVRLGSHRDKNPQARAAAVAESIAPDLPVLIDNLRGTGAGRVAALDNQGLCEVMRVTYDPHSADALDAAAMGTGPAYALSWDQIGPVAESDDWSVYQHDGCFTITSAMTIPPRSVVQADILDRLLEPNTNPVILRKRVAIKYWPVPLEKAADEAERDHSTAIFQKNGAGKKTVRHDKGVTAALQTATEVTSGAGLDAFVIVVSMTVGNREDIKAAQAAMRILPSTARLRMRPTYGLMAAGMAATTPVGFDPNRHMAKSKLGGRK